MELLWAFIGGVIVGAAIALAIGLVRSRQGRDAFAAVSQQVLADSGRQIVTLAEQVLKAQVATGAAQIDGKKQLIDQSLEAMNDRLERVRAFLQQVESERQKHYGELTQRLAALSVTTESLRKALAGSKRIGEWGERMTEDVLRLAGLQEGINYRKQSSQSAEKGIPDFTFLLPNDLVVNMDVKFPLEACLGYLEADSDEQRRARAGQFVQAVRGHVRAVAGRGYVNTAGGTVDYAIVFIPNEQVYSLALELEGALMDEALKQRVVLAGPFTLYAMLVVIRQSAENANIMKTADEVIQLLSAFGNQWRRYKETMDLMGKRLTDAVVQYDKLCNTRARLLERPLERIEELRTARGLAGPADQPPPPQDGPQQAP